MNPWVGFCHDGATWVMKSPGPHTGSIHVGGYKAYSKNRSLDCSAQCPQELALMGLLFFLVARGFKGDPLCSALIKPHSSIMSSLGSWRQAGKLKRLRGGTESLCGWDWFRME